jgi:O-methyltransferase involved in polyketide biosynthesis
MVVRSRFAEDTRAHAIGRGASQFVILGAGLDAFA